MPYNRGDVVLVLFPESNLRTAKRRPARSCSGKHARNWLAANNCGHDQQQPKPGRAPKPSNRESKSFEGRQMGLRTDSVIMTDNMATVLEREIDCALGTCPSLALIDSALRHTLGL